jgi:glycine/D-amino acid oxidase-like deaminating enzyme
MKTDQNRATIMEPAREIPVLMQADVVIVGGGTTGPIAAIAAARRGKKVVLIERFGSLGGILTLGLNTKPVGRAARRNPARRSGNRRARWGRGRGLHGHHQDRRREDRLAHRPRGDEDAAHAAVRGGGVQILFETFVSNPVVENGA